MNSDGDQALSPHDLPWLRPLRESVKQIASSEFVRHIVETFGTRVVLIGVGLVTTVLVTRALGPVGRGRYAIALAVTNIGVQFGNLGLHASNTYAVAKERRLLPSLVANSLAVSILFGGLGAAVAWGVFTVWPSLAPVHGTLLLIALAAVPFGLGYLLLQNLLLGIHEVRAFNALDLLSRLTALVAIGAMVVLGAATVEVLYGIVATVSVLTCTIACALLWRHFEQRPRLDLSLLIEHSRYGLKAYLGALFSFLVLRSDLFLVQYLRGAQETGYYSIAVALADMTYMLPVVVGTLMFPRLSALTDAEAKRHLAAMVTRRLGIAMAALAVVAAALSRVAVIVLFGRDFLPAVAPFLWLLPGIVLLSMHTILMNYFAAIGMPWFTVYVPLIAAVLNVVLNLFLIPTMGSVGAAIASTVAYGLMLACSAAFFHFDKQELDAVRSSR